MAERGWRTVGVRAADGVVIEGLEAGSPDGPSVLFLHGLGYGAAAWRHQLLAPELGRLRLVAVDLRGHGRSGWRAEDTFDGATWADDIAAILDQLELRDTTAVAWSYAGLVLADYLRVHGEARLRGLGLVAAATRAGFPEAYADFGAGALPDGLLSDDPRVSAAADAVFVAESAGRSGFDGTDADELRAIVSGTAREVLRRLLGRVVDNGALWAATGLPVLLTHGTADRINLPVISERQAGLIAGARASWYEGGGHLPFWEDPARFNRELLELVGS